MAVVEHILDIKDSNAQRQLGDLADKSKKAADELDNASESAHALGEELDDAGDKAEDAGDKAEDAGDKFDKAGDAAKGLEDKAGKAGSTLQAFASGLDLISPKAGELARGLGDVAGAMKGVGRLGGSFISIAGPVGIAVAGLGVAYKILAGNVEEAEQKMAAARAEAERAQALNHQVEVVALQAAVARGDVKPEDAASQIAGYQADATFDISGKKEQLQDLRRDLATTESALARAQQEAERQADFAGSGVRGGGAGAGAAQARLESLQAQVRSLKGEVGGAETALDLAKKGAEEYAKNLTSIATESGKTGRESETLARQIDKVGKSLQELLELDDQARTLAGIDRIIAKAELAAALAEGGLGIPSASAGLSGTDAANIAATFNANQAQDLPAVASPGRFAAGVGVATGAIGALGAGDIGGLANMQAGLLQRAGIIDEAAAGNVGMAVELANALNSIGALEVRDPETGEVIKSAAEVVGERLDAWFENTAKGIDALPEILGDKLPEAMEKGGPAIAAALVDSAPEIALALAKAVAVEFRTAMLDLPVAFAVAIAERLEEWWEKAKAFFRELLSGGLFKGDGSGVDWKGVGRTALRVGAGVATFGASEIVGRSLERNGVDVPFFHSGGLNDRERVAVLMQNERVYQEGEPPASWARGGGGEIHNHFHGPVMGPESVDWVREQLFGRYGADGGGNALWRPLGSS